LKWVERSSRGLSLRAEGKSGRVDCRPLAAAVLCPLLLLHLAKSKAQGGLQRCTRTTGAFLSVVAY